MFQPAVLVPVRVITLLVAPDTVQVPETVVVVPSVNLTVLVVVLDAGMVKLLNVVVPDIVCIELSAPSNVTVADLGVNVPEFAQLPATFILKLLPDTASSVPADIVRLPFTSAAAGRLNVVAAPLILRE